MMGALASGLGSGLRRLVAPGMFARRAPLTLRGGRARTGFVVVVHHGACLLVSSDAGGEVRFGGYVTPPRDWLGAAGARRALALMQLLWGLLAETSDHVGAALGV